MEASELASLFGARLGWRVLDSDIPVAVAKRLDIPPDSLEQWDEHAPRLLESIGHSLMLGSPDLLIDPAFVGRPDARDVAAAGFLEDAGGHEFAVGIAAASCPGTDVKTLPGTIE